MKTSYSLPFFTPAISIASGLDANTIIIFNVFSLSRSGILKKQGKETVNFLRQKEIVGCFHREGVQSKRFSRQDVYLAAFFLF
jgi:hypothetical protein